MRSFLSKRWGFALLCAFSLLSLVRLLTQKVPGHYRIFTGAGRALWHSQNPYGSDYGTGVGYYFYSPTCALTVFGPLSFLPEKLGIVVYMALSWALFVWGVRRFWAVFGNGRVSQCFWAVITAQLVGGILASKLEIAITGLLLACIAELQPNELQTHAPRLGRREIVAAITLAALLNWKFQPLPVVGLVLLARVLIWRDWKLHLLIGASLGGWYLLPFVFFKSELLARMHETWQTTFSTFVAGSVLNFENVFAFLRNAFGIPLSFAATQLVSGAVGLAFAATVAAWTLRTRPDSRPRGAALLSVALGTTFMTALSPLGQNNALILYAPLLLCAFIAMQESPRPRRWAVLLASSCATMILAYSDAVPAAWREALRHLSIKPLVCLILGLAVAVHFFKPQTQKENFS